MLVWVLGTVLLLNMPAGIAGSLIYKYQEENGVNLYTDRHLLGDKYTLIETIVGRPATAESCSGVTNPIIEQRAFPHLSAIAEYARFYNVDARMVKAIISVESCFDPYAVSRVGAQGLMQLMPATARELGVDDVFNANENIRGGIRYFSEMLTRFGHDVELALAAYNAGPGAVEKYQGIPPYVETQDYVRRVLGHYESYASVTR